MQTKFPLISVVVPTRANNFELFERLVQSLERQKIQDWELILVCDRRFTEQERSDFSDFWKAQQINKKVKLFSHLNSGFNPKSAGGASAVRNFGILQSRSEYIQLLDDDNEFGENFFEKELAYYKLFRSKLGKEIVICPTLCWRGTDLIQNQGFSGYDYWLARPKIHFLKAGQRYGTIQMFSGNGVFAKRELIQQSLYDEEFAWIAEDLEFVYRLARLAEVVVFEDLKIKHWEREKTILEQARIGTEKSSEQKVKNIFLRVKKHGNLMQTLIFLLWSSWGICIFLSLKALRYGGDQKGGIIRGIWSGWLRGMRRFLFNRSE